MSQYEKLDTLIVDTIAKRKNPLYDKNINEEAARLANDSGRETFRVIDGRLQALRKARKIMRVTKYECGYNGWAVV